MFIHLSHKPGNTSYFYKNQVSELKASVNTLSEEKKTLEAQLTEAGAKEKGFLQDVNEDLEAEGPPVSTDVSADEMTYS